MENTVVVFDFDCTIIDVDSDPWLAQQLGATPLLNSLQTQLPDQWNDMMNLFMATIHQQGNDIKHVEAALRSVPAQAETLAAIKAAHDLGTELRIISDANTFFIKTILEKYDLTHVFTKVVTNPSILDDQGRLHIQPYHPKSKPPHGCPLCPPNLCKGMIIDSIRTELPGKKIIYLGDGKGDFCPTLRLGPEDCVLPRRGYPLFQLIEQNAMSVKAKVYPWSTGKEMELSLLKLITSSDSHAVANST